MISTPIREAFSERFQFYGLIVEVSSRTLELVEEIRRDYSAFQLVSPWEPAQVRVEIRCEPPPYAALPAVRASVFTPRNVCFNDGGVSYIDYFGKGLAVFHRRERRCVVYGTDPDLIHEIAYHFILSTVGQHLDCRGMHRVHALGVSFRGRGILLLAPSGGGKSTMALELLRRPGFTLLGEDTPLVDRDGRLWPFPLRLGVRAGQDPGVPPEHLRTVQRMEFGPKTLIDIDYFEDRLSGSIEPGIILIGERSLGTASEIVPLPRHRAFKALLKYVVVGLGIYQGLEFLLERGLWEACGKGGVVASRLRNSLRLLWRARTYRFVLGRDQETNCRTLLEFLEQRCG
jgi:hypothetical protein